MKIRKSPLAASSALGLALSLTVLLGACDSRTAMVEPSQALYSGADVMFTPQPDSPREILRFLIETPELIDNPNLRDWGGTFGSRGGTEGVLAAVNLLPAVQHGETLLLKQRWSFISGGTSLPAVQVDGVLNLRSGRLVLNGRDSDGTIVHIQGWLTVNGDGSSIGGEVMFHP